MCITSRTVKYKRSLNWVTFSISGIPHLKETGTGMCIDSPLEMEMAIHSSILAWSSPWTEEPGGLQAVGSQRGRHNWATKHHHRQSTRAVVTEFHRPMAHVIHIDPLKVLKAGCQDCCQELVSGENSLPGLQTAVSLCLHEAFHCVHVHSWYLFLEGHPAYWIRALPSWAHLTVTAFSKALSNTVFLGFRASAY